MDDRAKPTLHQSRGYTMHRYLEAGAGLTTDTRGVPLSEGVEDRVGLGLGVDTLAQLQTLFG